MAWFSCYAKKTNMLIPSIGIIAILIISLFFAAIAAKKTGKGESLRGKRKTLS
jgi:hypothetical protein